MKPFQTFGRRVGILFGALFVSASVTAQIFPSKPIRIVVGFPPGGSTDLVARSIAPKMQEALGQPVIVENRPGAGGGIAVELAAKSPPDGHVLAISAPGALTVNMHFAKVPYHPLNDLDPVTMLVTSPLVLAVNASFPAQSVGELIAYTRTRPGAVSFSTIGPYTISFLAGELLKHMTGINIVAVPYKGGSPASAAIATGEVQMGFMDTTGVLPFVRSGRVRLLAIAESKRSVTLPDVPTMVEAGVPGYEANSWLAMVTAAGTPPEILSRLNAEVTRALAYPDVRERCLNAGLEPTPTSLAGTRQMLRTQFEKWRNLVKERGLKAE